MNNEDIEMIKDDLAIYKLPYFIRRYWYKEKI